MEKEKLADVYFLTVWGVTEGVRGYNAQQIQIQIEQIQIQIQIKQIQIQIKQMKIKQLQIQIKQIQIQIQIKQMKIKQLQIQICIFSVGVRGLTDSVRGYNAQQDLFLPLTPSSIGWSAHI